jgi:hypothetical protein
MLPGRINGTIVDHIALRALTRALDYPHPAPNETDR